MKLDILAYATKCYFILLRCYGRKLPAGLLSEIKSYHDLNITVSEACETIYRKLNTSRGIVARNSTVSIKGAKLSGLGTAIDIDTGSTVDMRDISVTECNKAIEVQKAKATEKYVMPLEITNSNFKRVNTVVRAPEEMLVKVDNSDFEDIEIGFDFYIPETDLESLGLPLDTPQEYLLEAAKIIRDNSGEDRESITKLVVNSRLVQWLNVTSSIVTVGTPIIANIIDYFS